MKRHDPRRKENDQGKEEEEKEEQEGEGDGEERTSKQKGEEFGMIQLRISKTVNFGFHFQELRALVSCPWSCGANFKPGDATVHMLDCPLAPDPSAQICCVHAIIGCRFKGPRKFVREHLVICPYEVVKEEMRHQQQQISSLQSTVRMQTEEIVMLRQRCIELQEQISSHHHPSRENGTNMMGKETFEKREERSHGIVDVHEETTHQEDAVRWIPQRCSMVLEGHKEGVSQLGQSVEYRKLFSASIDRTIRVWDISQHEPECVDELRGHRGGVTSLAVGRQKLVTGSADQTMKVWDLVVLKEEAALVGHTGLVHGVLLLNDLCVSVSQDKTIRFWDLRSGECVTAFETKSRGQYGIAVHELKLISAAGSKIYTWDLRKVAAHVFSDDQRNNFGRYSTLTGNTSGVFGHHMIGDRLYTSAVDSSIRLWDLKSMQVKSKISGHSDFVRALSSVGGQLISGSDDKTIRIWDVEFHDCIQVLRGHTSYINSLLCARGRLFSCSMDKTIRVWE
uniref:TRAF-type domain-containing protein n=1 Tax=Guillardia theta TaxID=55529 RepID=A0A7S4UBR3_GUITH|mmetsp:Transcript_503/g.1168  ORF Transcript_503/g.1168 Transcript_503/m.1168 type:complete len:508 (+) Transcript_503:43-1566(+)